MSRLLVKFSEKVSKIKWIHKQYMYWIIIVSLFVSTRFMDSEKYNNTMIPFFIWLFIFFVYVFVFICARSYDDHKTRLFKKVNQTKQKIYFNQAVDAIIRGDIDIAYNLKDNFIKGDSDKDYILGILLGYMLSIKSERNEALKALNKNKYEL